MREFLMERRLDVSDRAWARLRRMTDKQRSVRNRLPAVIYVPADGQNISRNVDSDSWFKAVPGLADLTWSPPELRDKFRPIGYYWVSFWSALEEVCHWDGHHWRSTGDEREWVSRDVDRVWETTIVRQR